jgi:hypothetical protein
MKMSFFRCSDCRDTCISHDCNPNGFSSAVRFRDRILDGSYENGRGKLFHCFVDFSGEGN